MNVIHKIVFVLSFGIIFHTKGISQPPTSQSSFFKSRDFGNYTLADKYAPITKVGTGVMIVLPDYNIDNSKRKLALVANPILGCQIPIYTGTNESHKIALSSPISFSVWFDYTEPRTAPILNTDYRFAILELNYSYKFKNSKLKNIGIRFIPFFHESTHVGDELVVSKFSDTLPVARINVSYETYELAILFNDPYNNISKNHSFRIGAKFLWNKKKGYYTADPLEKSKNVNIKHSKRWIEPYFQYQFQKKNKTFLSTKSFFVFSSDFNLRVRYDYPFTVTTPEGKSQLKHKTEAYQISINCLAGLKFSNQQKHPGNIGLFFNLYYGINPHGQFRNIPYFPWIGAKLIYDFK